MKIYAIALGFFIFCSFSAVIQEMGVFGNIYSHENTFEVNIDEKSIDGLKQISGDDLMSDSELSDSNPDTGGVSTLIKSLGVIVNILEKTLFIDKLIMEYVPPGGKELVQPFATFMKNIMLLIYAVGLISWYRKYRVG